MLMGIPVPRIFLITFAVGSALVGLAACVMMPLFSVFPTVGLNFVLIAFVIVVLGGMGSIEGALLGGICIGVVQSVSSYYIAPAYRADVLLHPVPAGDDLPARTASWARRAPPPSASTSEGRRGMTTTNLAHAIERSAGNAASGARSRCSRSRCSSSASRL